MLLRRCFKSTSSHVLGVERPVGFTIRELEPVFPRQQIPRNAATAKAAIHAITIPATVPADMVLNFDEAVDTVVLLELGSVGEADVTAVLSVRATFCCAGGHFRMCFCRSCE